MINPTAPSVNMKLAAKPSMIYWPFTRCVMKATYWVVINVEWQASSVITGLEFPLSSVCEPILGGSLITSYMTPGVGGGVISGFVSTTSYLR